MDACLTKDAVLNLPLGIVVYRIPDPQDPQTAVFECANEAAHRLLRGHLHPYIGNSVKSLPEFPDILLQAMAAVAQSGKTTQVPDFHYASPQLDGWFRATFYLIQREPLLVGEVLEDISTLKEMEERRIRAEGRYRAFVRSSPDMLHLMSPDGRFLDTHPGRLPALMPPIDFLGKHMRDILPPPLAAEAEENIRRALESGDVQTWEYSLDQLPGYTFEARFAPTPQGEVLVTIRDATQMKQIQTRLKQAVDERTRRLEASNEALLSFAYAASHDLREPLIKIMSFGSRLKDMLEGNLPAQAGDYLNVMVSASHRMLQLIDDLLSYSRAGGEEGIPPRSVDLNRVVLEALSDLDPAIQEAGAEIRLGPLPNVRGYPARIRQVFQNLISNAVKFRKPGVPPVIQIEGREEGEWGIVVIRDNGIGFEPEQAESLFTIFTRLHTRFEYPGTGVGLALCRRILNQIGGTIKAEGEPGVGAVFTLAFPMNHAEVEGV